MPAGRPEGIAFADDMVEELLARLEKGEQLTGICEDPRMPGRTTVYRWVDSDPEFSGRFRAAKAKGVHALVEQCIEIADEKAVDAVHVANKRVRIDTRLRLAGKWLAKEYGDKIDVNYNAEVTHRHDLSRLSPDELDALERLVSKGSDTSGDQSGESPQESGSVH